MKQQDIQRLSNLQLALIDTQKAVAILRSACIQLSADKCQTVISFDLHNIDRHEKNHAGRYTEETPLGQFYIGMPVTPPEDNTCRTIAKILFSESPALRILTAMLREMEMEERKLTDQITEIFKGQLTGSITLNPVLELNS